MGQHEERLYPAKHVIEKLGGAAIVAELTGRTTATVHKWTYPKSRGGTDGHIPASVQHDLMEAARAQQLPLSADDFFVMSEGAA